ncbi:hypothetical protein K7432_006585 [Basidiobolus ranarum]|uniref:Uncharacterized protein n=1 Tax=Basidiobolus ranarum TaxID=34480 RepID=A0ABR2W1E5_9FUNG
MGARFQLEEVDSGFVMIYSSDETWSLPEQEVELFEDIVGQIEIALQQSAQLQNEYSKKLPMSSYTHNVRNQRYLSDQGLSSLRQSAVHPVIKSSSPPPPPPPPFSSEDIQDYEEYDMEPKYWN